MDTLQKALIGVENNLESLTDEEIDGQLAVVMVSISSVSTSF